MIARVMCPACQYKISIPEGEMTKRQVCPNCQSPFIAGKTEAEAAMSPPPSMLASRPPREKSEAEAAMPPQPGYVRTMLADTAPPIKFNCPRCKAPLEAPASEAGVKKPCSACGQRLQVPAAPPPPAPVAAQPNLAKTMLAGDESRAAPAAPPITYNCPNCKKPLQSPSNEAGIKKPCPFCNQRLQVPTAATAPVNKTMLATNEGNAAPGGLPSGYPMPAGTPVAAASGAAQGAAPVPTGITIGSMTITRQQLAIGVGVFILLLVVVPAVIRGGKTEDTAAIAKNQQELEKLKAEIEVKKNEGERLKLSEAEIRRRLDGMDALIRAQDDKNREEHRQAMNAITDDNKRREQEQRYADKQRSWEQEKQKMAAEQQKLLADAKASLEANEKALKEAQNKQQTIIQQPPPYYYHPPYHYRYYYPW